MRLLRVLNEALSEQSEDLLEFPAFTVTVDRNKRKLIFAPQLAKGNVAPSELRTLLNLLKRDFNVLRVVSLEDEGDAKEGDEDDKSLRGMFEVEVDPREDFNSLIDYIKNHSTRK